MASALNCWSDINNKQSAKSISFCFVSMSTLITVLNTSLNTFQMSERTAHTPGSTRWWQKFMGQTECQRAKNKNSLPSHFSYGCHDNEMEQMPEAICQYTGSSLQNTTQYTWASSYVWNYPHCRTFFQCWVYIWLFVRMYASAVYNWDKHYFW